LKVPIGGWCTLHGGFSGSYVGSYFTFMLLVCCPWLMSRDWWIQCYVCRKTQHSIPYCSIMLHCVDLTFSVTFSFCIQLRLMFTLLLYSVNICYMFQPDWPPVFSLWLCWLDVLVSECGSLRYVHSLNWKHTAWWPSAISGSGPAAEITMTSISGNSQKDRRNTERVLSTPAYLLKG
jgi:hypothetical protein